MLSAIGSLQASSAAPAIGTSKAGIEAQIVRYKKELSDCVNCDSAKTPEGKAAIQAVSNKISTAEARLEKIADNKPISQPSASNTTTDAPTKADAIAPAPASRTNTEPAPVPRLPDSAAGSLINVFA